MKLSLLVIAFFIASMSGSIAQSRSFQTLEEKFSSSENVHAFKTSGFFARTVLWLAGEHEFNRAIKNVKDIRLITIPKSAFHEKEVSVHGFQKVVRNDAYQELVSLREGRDEVVIYLRPTKHSSLNRYLILIDNPDEVVAVEIKGYIDADLLTDKGNKLSTSFNKKIQ